MTDMRTPVDTLDVLALVRTRFANDDAAFYEILEGRTEDDIVKLLSMTAGLVVATMDVLWKQFARLGVEGPDPLEYLDELEGMMVFGEGEDA